MYHLRFPPLTQVSGKNRKWLKTSVGVGWEGSFPEIYANIQYLIILSQINKLYIFRLPQLVCKD